DVLHQGLANRSQHAMGTVSIVVGVLVLLLWIPLRQWPGLGTVSNVLVLGLAMNQTLVVLPSQHRWPAQLGMLAGGIVLCGLATGMYIAAGLGPGPRDGLMTGIARRTGLSIRLTRTSIELTVLVGGWLLGGSVGLGTVLFAVTIGPLSQFFLRLLRIPGLIGAGKLPDPDAVSTSV
ncbi:MAG: YczE/YyaS/YitT family protein, partial [Jatrophihabitans sp.]